ncbi:hypothetical protein AVEN_13604-1 [Araneus ventricosus]|uniref:Uncharacterized protein n=1 Tax=Araneus ventricosus TaxID=182803 RepID=A0A4Y2PWH3_ARAVE|nr:hypothetical protein AVEN_13604-1 [Araneus ventricosus]
MSIAPVLEFTLSYSSYCNKESGYCVSLGKVTWKVQTTVDSQRTGGVIRRRISIQHSACGTLGKCKFVAPFQRPRSVIRKTHQHPACGTLGKCKFVTPLPLIGKCDSQDASAFSMWYSR